MTNRVLVQEQSSAADSTIAWPHQPLHPVRHTAAQRIYLRLRRAADVLLAGVGILVAAVPMLLVSAGVIVTMGRPVLFTQERISKDGRIFRLRKFRSMREAGTGPGLSDADRLVPFGRFLRSTSLDELPSLWNILRGDMSLIGPRPLTVDYLGRYSTEQFTRHAVPAGLTGLAQVNGRNAIDWDCRLQLDRDYVQNVGPLPDLRILLSTVPSVLGRAGVTDSEGVSMSDFPGPQSTSQLELHGPDDDGVWECIDRRGRVIAEGASAILEDGVVRLSFHAGGQGGGAPSQKLDDVVRLVVSRARARDSAEWALISPDTEISELLAESLKRSGFMPPSTGMNFPSRMPPPSSLLTSGAPLVAFIGLPTVEKVAGVCRNGSVGRKPDAMIS